MKIMKAFTSALIIIMVVFCSIYTAFAAVYIEDWGFRFEKNNNGSAYEVNKYISEDEAAIIPNSYNGFPITSIGQYAFIDTSVTSVTLGDNITGIKTGAFINVDTLTDITFNEGLTTIGKTAFANCTALSDVTFPNSVTSISDDAFDGCDSLVIHCYKDSYAHQYAVKNSISLVLIEDAPPTEPPTDPPTDPPTESGTEITFILGDADGDEVVSVLDATKVQRVLAALDSDEDGMIALRGDVNGDSLTILDATAIQRWIADYEVNDPIGTEVTRIISPSSQN